MEIIKVKKNYKLIKKFTFQRPLDIFLKAKLKTENKIKKKKLNANTLIYIFLFLISNFTEAFIF